MTREDKLKILKNLPYTIIWPEASWTDILGTERQLWVNSEEYGYFLCDEPNLYYWKGPGLDLSKWNDIRDKIEKESLTFGDFETIYSYNFIINNPLNKIAKNINSYYIQRNYIPEYVKNYHFISETDRRQSVAFAIHIKYKLHMLGYELNPSAFVSKSQKDELKSLIDKNIEELIIYEQGAVLLFVCIILIYTTFLSFLKSWIA